ncbi:fumarylacetoacetate hydrolase family protein [Sphingobium phenoxybenzoativorans]|uniref:Fumarylacetoacetate hydrolase family protein n=1 Tax=Sphingobium phenoxybenzoativorans TaxID=1592790 RepID=A0A975Q1E4_9SPHN|nr:fumarylacetoacetate hydrolase family protein [Sphingobium phenoxybenzoativorans]QUT05576.1 fumarylacetoacetate hydrolase family protein [Sphingobium phenoxybenzoativorans]
MILKLCRFETQGSVGIGAVKDHRIAPLQVDDVRTLDDLIALDNDHRNLILANLDQREASIQLHDVRLLSPIVRPGKYLGIGLNYADHAAEAANLGLNKPNKQTWFNKQTSCISGPFDPVLRGNTVQLDYEVELGVVIGAVAKNVSVERARDYVFGYFVANDVSARDFQFHSPTITIGKSFDTHGPIGPWIVTADEIADPHALQLRCLVNGATRQEANTRDMIANIWEQIAYLSSAFTLYPGDLLATGTPSGVGVAMSPQQFLQPGDVVRCEIEGVGTIENRVE